MKETKAACRDTPVLGVNFRDILPAAVILLATGAWLTVRSGSIQEAKSRMDELERKISRALIEHHRRGQVDEAGVDWVGLEKTRHQMRAGSTDQRKSWLVPMSKLLQLDEAGLMAAYDDLLECDLSPESRAIYEKMILGAGELIAPEWVLERFADKLDSNEGPVNVAWYLCSAFERVLESDPAKAMEWYEQQRKERRLGGKQLGVDLAAVRYEVALINHLLVQDPDAAKARFAELPEEARRQGYNVSGAFPLDEGAGEAFADMVRSIADEAERGTLLGDGCSELFYQKGYSAVTAYLDRISASPDERRGVATEIAKRCVSNASWNRGLEVGDVREMWDWLWMECPESADQITGQALASVSWEGYLESRVEIIEELRRKGVGDGMVTGFIEAGAVPPESAESRRLVEQIEDEELRRRASVTLGLVPQEEP